MSRGSAAVDWAGVHPGHASAQGACNGHWRPADISKWRTGCCSINGSRVRRIQTQAHLALLPGAAGAAEHVVRAGRAAAVDGNQLAGRRLAVLRGHKRYSLQRSVSAHQAEARRGRVQRRRRLASGQCRGCGRHRPSPRAAATTPCRFGLTAEQGRLSEESVVAVRGHCFYRLPGSIAHCPGGCPCPGAIGGL